MVWSSRHQVLRCVPIKERPFACSQRGCKTNNAAYFCVSVFMSLSQLIAAAFHGGVSLVISKDFCYLTDSIFLLRKANYRIVYHGKGTPDHLLGGML